VRGRDLARIPGYPLAVILTRVLFPLTIAGRSFLPRRGPALVAPNHQGYLDPLFVQMATARPIRYLMTADFFDLRLFRWFFELTGAIRVPEGGVRREALRRALAALADGDLVGIFPEGRLSRDGRWGALSSGVSFLARHAGVPVVPARIRGSLRVFGKGRRLRQASVSLRFGPPLPPGDCGPERVRSAWEAL